MPSYAVLGATGATGSALVNLLLTQDVDLAVYARSEARLREKFPNLPPKVSIHVGSIHDDTVIANCIKNADVVFAAAATNHNNPNCSIARDTADSIIRASQGLEKRPVVVVLSAMPVNTTLRKQGRFGQWLLYQAQYYIYEDLRLAAQKLRDHHIDLIEAQAPLIVNGTGGGYKVTEGTRLDEIKGKLLLTTYNSLANAMVSLAGSKPGEYVVYSDRPEELHPNWGSILMRNLVPGLICTWMRPVWHIGLWMRLWKQ